jgi:hypothetical protein
MGEGDASTAPAAGATASLPAEDAAAAAPATPAEEPTAAQATPPTEAPGAAAAADPAAPAAAAPGARKAAPAATRGSDDALNLGTTVLPVLVKSYWKQALAGVAVIGVIVWIVTR